MAGDEAGAGVPDEQALAEHLPGATRKVSGIFFTPHELVRAMVERARALLGEGAVTVADPSSGGGAFLAQAAQVFGPAATLLGLELHPPIARACRARLPGAEILEGDALRGGFERLAATAGPSAPLLLIGNPPYNGTSALLGAPSRRAELQRLLGPLPRGNSLRDDFAFFLLLAAEALADRQGLLAFVTPVSLLDAFLYAPLRRHLLERLRLLEVWELGPDVFRGTQVRTCVTFWSSRRGGAVGQGATFEERTGRMPPRDHDRGARGGATDRAHAAGRPALSVRALGAPGAEAVYRGRTARGAFRVSDLGPPQPLEPVAPDHLLRPLPAEAVALDRSWRSEGEPLTALIPISFPGLKTRFDELLTDEDPDRLLARVDDFLRARDLDEFLREHPLPERVLPKLRALKATQPEGLRRASRENVRRFFRYAGARHRGRIPSSAHAYCYLDRALIPRGDHRLRGAYDPHRGDLKLVFNLRELPLSAAIAEGEGCVHDHRHARFAPLWVPRRLLEEGLEAARRGGDLGPLVPNLSARGLERAQGLGGARPLFEAVCDFLNSGPFQQTWAPAFGTFREPSIPLAALRGR